MVFAPNMKKLQNEVELFPCFCVNMSKDAFGSADERIESRIKEDKRMKKLIDLFFKMILIMQFILVLLTDGGTIEIIVLTIFNTIYLYYILKEEKAND